MDFHAKPRDSDSRAVGPLLAPPADENVEGVPRAGRNILQLRLLQDLTNLVRERVLRYENHAVVRRDGARRIADDALVFHGDRRIQEVLRPRVNNANDDRVCPDEATPMFGLFFSVISSFFLTSANCWPL